MSRTSPCRTSALRRVLNGFLVLAMLIVGTLAADRATAHAAMAVVHAAQPPCHRLHHDALAPTPVDACDTVCAGSAPESTYDAAPVRLDAPMPVVMAHAPMVLPAPRGGLKRALHYGHGPPPLPAFLRDRRLLI